MQKRCLLLLYPSKTLCGAATGTLQRQLAMEAATQRPARSESFIQDLGRHGRLSRSVGRPLRTARSSRVDYSTCVFTFTVPRFPARLRTGTSSCVYGTVFSSNRSFCWGASPTPPKRREGPQQWTNQRAPCDPWPMRQSVICPRETSSPLLERPSRPIEGALVLLSCAGWMLSVR